VLALVTAAIWSDTFREALARPRQSVPWAVAGLGVVFASAVAMAAMQPETRPQGELPFPADSLRTELRAPEVKLTNHRGQPVDLSELRGKVVVVTAVYASCGFTCPTILQQAKASLEELTPEERADVVVLGISLDAAHDSPEVLARLAEGQQLTGDGWHLLTGEPAVVEQTLLDLGFSWTKDPETGRIDHANLFMVVDRDGRIAYRLGLGERQQRWLVSALKTLLLETAS
jgi:protein SCO1/2